ncbi:MAG TPA: hypothetical protein VM491_16310 [Burkholderiaceae bacterium]|nr:hypothetical protein [Burkholderiaceae bacterium]
MKLIPSSVARDRSRSRTASDGAVEDRRPNGAGSDRAGAGELWQVARSKAEAVAARSGLTPEHPSWTLITNAFAAGYVAGREEAAASSRNDD